MDKASFFHLFKDAVELAVKAAEKSLGRKLSRDVIVRMYGAGTNGVDMSPRDFINRAYINETTFYRIIDLMVVETILDRPVLFARISGHPPGPLVQSWKGDQGPFRQLTAETIEQTQH